VSKYRNKQKQSKPKVFKQGEPRFDYTSTCCGVPASKKACSKGNGEPDDSGFFQSPLGTWNCGACRRKCKVNRTVRKPKEIDVPKNAETSTTLVGALHAV
jgi:hypothetical protein